MAAALFSLLLLSIISLSQASVNIDCGTSLPWVDNNNIKWVGDKDFITSGTSATVSSTTDGKELTTLRYFPTGDSNCYSSIPVTKGGKVLMRTRFYYGNYDGKSSYPTFDVLFEGKYRCTLSISSATDYFLELIFSSASGETSVCFVRTSSSSNPFVSSIEVVDLDDGMYNDLRPGEGLLYQQRIAYGTKEYLRSDLQGRFWNPSEENILWTVETSTSASINTSDASNKPPESILRNTWSGESLFIDVPITFLSVGVPVYLAMYFSEPLQGNVRSFNILYGGKQVGNGPIVPVYGKATQLVVRDVVASSSSELVFQSTASVLLPPPMINALELYVIISDTSGSGDGNGSGAGGGGGGGGGSGSGGSEGSGGTGNGGSGGSNDVSSGGSARKGKNKKLPTIVGSVSVVTFFLIAYVFIAITLRNRRKARLQALAIPTSVANTGTAESPLFEDHVNNDSNQPAYKSDMGDINDLIGVNQSYVAK